VLLGDVEVGVLVRTGEHSRFEPSQAWAEQPAGERPVLGQQFEEDPYAAHVGRNRMGVPLWFEHLLPEVGGPLRDAVAAAADVSPARGFSLLLLLGEELPGAVRVRPLDGEVSFRTVSRRVRENRAGDVSDDPLPLRVSLAGVQFKISARLGKRGIAVPGWDEEGDWIVKFADQAHTDLPAIEYWTMRWAAEAGMNVPEVRLVETSSIDGIDHLAHITGQHAFAIERYDRSASGRVHQEDFAQVLGLDAGRAKYDRTNIDTIVNIVARLAPRDVEELLTRIVFTVLAGNDDAHAKNWSFWYPDGTNVRLSPAYDLVATLVFPQYAANTMALRLAGIRRFEDVNLRSFETLARATGLESGRVEQVVRSAVQRQVAAWGDLREESGVHNGLRHFLDDRLATLRLARQVLG
jgi:serine/threonine-protein kinase HipA